MGSLAMANNLKTYLCTLGVLGCFNLVLYVTAGAFIQACSPLVTNSSLPVTNRFEDPVRDRFGSVGCVLVYVVLPVVFFPIASLLVQFCSWKYWKKNINLRWVVMVLCIIMFMLISMVGLSINRCWIATYGTYFYLGCGIFQLTMFVMLQCSLHKINASHETITLLDDLGAGEEAEKIEIEAWSTTPYALSVTE